MCIKSNHVSRYHYFFGFVAVVVLAAFLSQVFDSFFIMILVVKKNVFLLCMIKVHLQAITGTASLSNNTFFYE